MPLAAAIRALSNAGGGSSGRNYTDLTGQFPWLFAGAALWGLFEAGTAALDAYSTINAFADPCASNFDKMVSGGLFGLSLNPRASSSSGAMNARERA